MKIINKVSGYFNAKPYLSYITLFLMSLGFFSFLQASPTFPDPDSFYHAKLAVLLARFGVIYDFPWLSATTLRFGFIDHHFLYHLLLVPFVSFLPPLIGIKVATALFGSLVILTIYWFLKQLKVSGALWYCMFLLTINPFIFRLNLAKATALSLVLLFLTAYFIFNRRYTVLLLTSFIFVWLYGGWPIALALALIYFILSIIWPIQWRGMIIAKFGKLKVVFQNFSSLMHVLIGCIVGLVLFPYFPKNLAFYWQQTFKIAVVNYQKIIAVGGEWYPYHFSDLVLACLPLFILLVLALIGFIITIRKQTVNSWFFLILSVIFFAFTLKSRRYVEYFVPLSVVFSAVSINNYQAEARKWLESFLPRCLVMCLPLILLLAFSPFFFQDLKSVKDSYDQGISINKFSAASSWLKNNAASGEIVFNCDWDEFPELFYYNDQNYYIVGLDPTFMYEYNHAMYQEWLNITTGQPVNNLYGSIKEVFNAKYVLVDYNQNQILARNLEENINFKEVYNDSEAKIFEVIE